MDVNSKLNKWMEFGCNKVRIISTIIKRFIDDNRGKHCFLEGSHNEGVIMGNTVGRD